MPVATVAAPSDPPSNNESMVKSEKDGEQNVVNNIEINNLMDPPKGDDDESERQSPQSIHRSSTANLMRSRSDARPMNATKRFWKVVTRLLLCQTKSEAFETKQVRVPTREEKGSFVHGLTLASDGSLTRLSNWLLQLKFLSVIGMFLVIYMIIIFLFSMILGLAINVAYAKTGATCCEEYEFAENTFLNNVGVVFELSWTTFATVGYGVIAVPEDQSCEVIRYTLAIEAFIGILYTSICGAIFYSKIMRLHTEALVTFSSSVCLQYGKGVTDSQLDVVSSDKVTKSITANDSETVVNFPVLEMRCVNDRAGISGGEILGASLTCFVSKIEQVGDNEIGNDRNVDLLIEYDSDTEEPRGVAKKMTFAEFEVTPNTHPYFSTGAWYFRHVLDHKSPLLKASVAKRIVELGGWPADLDSPFKIRGCFDECVEEIIISFTGTSNMTADRVFMNQCYRLSDVYIGWKFAGMAYFITRGRKKQPKVELDLTLIHDILPSPGEEHEPLGSPGPNAFTFRVGDQWWYLNEPGSVP